VRMVDVEAPDSYRLAWQRLAKSMRWLLVEAAIAFDLLSRIGLLLAHGAQWHRELPAPSEKHCGKKP